VRFRALRPRGAEVWQVLHAVTGVRRGLGGYV
jgi:hypothetical protein